MPQFAKQFIVTDTNLLPLAKQRFKKDAILVIPHGESYKRLATIEAICNELVQLGAQRDATIVGFGGGVVGDMAGLVASVYMRGVKLVQVPTTLLAMVDSSIGGKNGVDLVSGKNLVGTFYPATEIVRDPKLLLTLPDAEFSNGMGEVVKHGVLDTSLFTWLEKNVDNINQRHLPTLKKMIQLNVELKEGIVGHDPKEHMKRMLLNLGHTFGHAFEKLSDYQLPHGQAVAIGLAYASAFSEMPERARVLNLLHEFGLPTSFTKAYPSKAIVQAMQHDKKNRSGKITLVLPIKLGEVVIDQGYTPKIIEQWLKQYQA